MNVDLYNEKLLSLLQTKVIFKCKNKTIKTGIIKLFSIKQYFIKFYIEQALTKETKILELPYPFELNVNSDKSVNFNYRLSCLPGIQSINTTKKIKSNSTSHKFYDNIITIIPVN